MVRREEVQEFTADPLQTVQYERDFLPILVTVAVILRVSPISPLSYQNMAEDHTCKGVGECHPYREFEGMQPSR
jgi:hypothetical protein